ncbi:amidohydrolase family protein [Paenibacillus sp. S-38]|uniref:amidohydrolase family protein n=1 Tax=Paenibacillus sp. S-38 TaxID=3416710 RepID=UPI003CE76844
MSPIWKTTPVITAGLLVLLAGGTLLYRSLFPGTGPVPAGISPPQQIPANTSHPAAAEAPARVTAKSTTELLRQYGGIPLIDAHNHDAESYTSKLDTWSRLGVDRIVLFGDVSEPSAVRTDEMAWNAYQQAPQTVIPFSSGIHLLEESGLKMARANLEKGFFGLGELAAASTRSPVLAKVAWKTKDPMDGILPRLYELCAEYQAPLLLHIDPPNGPAGQKLEEALEAYPKTTFIFAHANAFNSPENLRKLLERHPNLYMDFFAGFTALNPESSHTLADFVPVMREYPDRFMLSTDSGFGLPGGEEAAIESMYRLLDALDDPGLQEKIAHRNLETLIHRQPATATQREAIAKHNASTGHRHDAAVLTKAEAGLILAGKE